MKNVINKLNCRLIIIIVLMNMKVFEKWNSHEVSDSLGHVLKTFIMVLMVTEKIKLSIRLEQNMT